MPVYTTSSSTSGMPAVTSASSSSTSYTYVVTIPTGAAYETNPYIAKAVVPANTVFIGLGGVGAAALVTFGVALVVIWLISRKQAKRDKEVYFHSGASSAGSFGSQSMLLGSSQSSLFEKLSSSSRLYRQNTNNTQSFDTTTPGRAYREMLTLERRGSMTISPVLELMMHSSRSNLELPLFHSPDSTIDSPVLMGDPTCPDTFLTDSRAERDPARRERPPSQVLDDMLLGIDFASRYPNLTNHEI